MNWLSKLVDLMIVGGFSGVVVSALPQHIQRRARERLSDLNPYNVISGNHDLMRVARLAWVRAAFDVLDAAKDTIDAGYSKFDRSDTLRFEKIARDALLKVRSEALDRRIKLDHSPIDHHLEIIMQGTSEFVATGENNLLDQSLIGDFNQTLAALTGEELDKIPPIFVQIAQAGLPTVDQSTNRQFSELVFSAFAELLKSPDQYPEAMPAFIIAMDNAARELSQRILGRIKDIDEKFNHYVVNNEALKAFKTGVAAYLEELPKLLDGQARIEALALTISNNVYEIKADTNVLKAGMSQMLQSIEAMGRSSAGVTEEEAFAEYQALVRHINQREFEQVLIAHKPRSLGAYRAWCIARWAQSRYAIDKQFTPLTLMLDQGEDAQGTRYQKDHRSFSDLRDVLKAVDPIKEPVIVVTGAPGSGKSTLLRRLELDLASSALRSNDSDTPITIFLPLNTFGQKDVIPEPIDWLAKHWAEITTGLLDFNELLRNRLVLLFDGLNEMPHASREDYDNRLAVWKRFLDQLVLNHPNVRVVFSCRTLDYGSKLTTKELPLVPQVEVTPLTSDQVERFLQLYSPENAPSLWAQLKDSRQFDLYRSPYYLKLLIEQVDGGKIPEGRAELFTGHVRAMLQREIDGDNSHLHDDYFFHTRDRKRFGQWRSVYALPARGQLFKVLAIFAFRLQAQSNAGDTEDKSQVRVDYDEALANLPDVPEAQQDGLLKVAADLQILDLPGNDVLFVHQLLQEYFAARYLVEQFNTASGPEVQAELINLAQVQWLVADIKPGVQDQLQMLSKSETLPDLRPTGWEETFLLAAAMVAEAADGFLQALAKVNLPLAGRCAAQPDVMVSDSLRQDLQQSLVARSRDPATDLRARISAANALGALGDPRFEVRQGEFGRFLLPPMVAIDGGVYAIGSDEGLEKDEARRHEVQLASFALARFPVTNAEFQCFIDAGGYQDQRWWDTLDAKCWQRGEGTGEGSKENWRRARNWFKGGADRFANFTDEQAWTEESIQEWQAYIGMTDDAFEAVLSERWLDQQFSQPAYWNDPAYNAPNQPVVGVCWFEVRAYCAWLSAQTEQCFRLPSEAEWEAAASGREGRQYAWGDGFDVTCCNVLETKLRRTTPVGVFSPGDTPPLAAQKGLSDLSGNVWEWTSSCYSPYPYNADDGRESINVAGDYRVLRGGSWSGHGGNCRSAYRGHGVPSDRSDGIGFRLARGH